MGRVPGGVMQSGGDPAMSHDEEAAIWFTRLRRGGGSPGEQAAFQAWLRADPRHGEAFRAVGGLWGALDQCEAALAANLPAAAPSLGRRSLWKPVAATALAASAAGLWLGTETWRQADISTGAGERRSQRLADGSLVEMDASTALATDLQGGTRQVRLLSGQAFFAVEADAARPFEVLAADGLAHTARAHFGVSLLREDVRVVTLGGAVAVRQATRQVPLGRAQSAEYGPAGLRGPMVADIGSLMAWRQDQMIFRAARLRDVVRDLERYRGGRILITDGAAGDISVSGAFSTRDPDAVLDAIGKTLPVRIRRLAGYLVLISAA